MNKFGFVLNNYKAKLQIEIKSLNKKLDGINNEDFFLKIKHLYLKYKLKKRLKEKREILKYIKEYINYIKKEEPSKLDIILSVEESSKLKNLKIKQLDKFLNQ